MQAGAVRALAALWLLLFVTSFVAFFVIEPTGDGFTRGLNRLASFLTWQGAAFAPAVICAFLTYRFGDGAQRYGKLIGYGPLAVSVSLVGLLIAIIAFRVLVQPELP
jgi:hypothetical protein